MFEFFRKFIVYCVFFIAFAFLFGFIVLSILNFVIGFFLQLIQQGYLANNIENIIDENFYILSFITGHIFMFLSYYFTTKKNIYKFLWKSGDRESQ